MVCDRLLEALSREPDLTIEKVSFQHGELYRILFKGILKGYILKPNTYMNLSGIAVKAFLHTIDRNVRVVVVMDDFAIKLGIVRLRTSGGHGGHRGMASVLNTLTTEDIPRVKVGTGPLPEEVSAEHFVLTEFSDIEMHTISKAIDTAAELLRKALLNPDKVLQRNFSIHANT